MKTSVMKISPWKLVLSAIVAVVSTSIMAQDVEIKTSERLLDKDQPSKAIETLNQAITTYPIATKLYYYLGYVQLKKGEQDKALKTFEKGISLNDKEAINHVGPGAIRMLEKKPTEAKVFFDKALAMSKSKDVSVLQAVAEAYLVDAKYSETALKLLEKAKALDANNPKTFMLMGEADLLQNKGGPAITNSERAIRLDPTNAKPYYSIAMVYMRSQNFTLAEENFQKAISIDPEYTLAYKELGELYYSMKEGEKAVKAYESYLKLTEKPDLAQTQQRYAFFLFMARNFAKANEVFKKLAERPDVSPTTLRYYAYSLFEAGDFAGSQKMFEKYFSTVPADKIEALDHSYYGKLLQKVNQDSLAIISFQKSLTLNQDQADITQLLAETLFKLKKYQESINAYEALFKIRKKPLSVDYFTLGRAYYNTEQYEKADTIFQKFVELQPNMSVSYLWAGRTKANIDSTAINGLAKPAYEKLIELASASPEKSGSKNELLEAYRYFGFYHYQKGEIALSKSFWKKVLAIDPNDKQALDVLKEFDK